ncbi:disease resistance protein RGA4-like [Miscanthus floridulus]|uniref:disease resistance protein RGA4-like n=1 Tax=Miscanthus floridulus TaxID=154761 RepID=UPI003459BD52
METALVSGFIKIIVPRLFSLSSEKYKLHKSVKGNVEFLQHELEMIARTIDDQISRGEHLSSARTQWIQELRQLAYEIEDCIDRYVYRLTYKQQASSIRRATMVLASSQVADEIRKLRDKADLVGIDVPQEELLELLEDDEVERRRKVISIVGFNGVGKTVLAEQVYENDAANQFSPKAWIDAQEKDAKAVLLSVHSSLGLHNEVNEPLGTSNVKLLSSKLEGYLQDKRVQNHTNF